MTKEISLKPEEALLGGCKVAATNGPFQGSCTLPSSRSTIETSRRDCKLLSDRFFLGIADITCALLSADPGLSIRVPGATSEFLTHEIKPDVRVQARWDDLSAIPAGGDKIFDSGNRWQLYHDNTTYRFRGSPPAFGPVPYDIARMRHDFTFAGQWVTPILYFILSSCITPHLSLTSRKRAQFS